MLVLDTSMQRELKKGKYRHFKGNEYLVVDSARCSETDAQLVIYKPLYDDAYRGYLEDRRPNSQGDPYVIASRVIQTIQSVPTA